MGWYRENARDLPWRHTEDPYRIWVSEIMLQQTRVAAVLGYYARFLAVFPSVEMLAEGDEEQLMKLWEGLGYYSRARNLQKAARQLMGDFGGVFPSTYEDIHSLAGVGDYTAGAIASIAFGLPVPAVDGNLLRVTARITGDEGDITSPAMKKKITAALAEIIPVDAPGAFNQAMMELGATVCLPNGAPLCEKCPAAAFFRKAQIFNLQHLRLLGKINASFKSVVLCILSYHILYDPAKLNIFNCCIIYIFTISKNSNMVTNLHNLFKTMGNIYDGNALGI